MKAVNQIQSAEQKGITVEEVASGVEEFAGWVFTALKVFIGLAMIVLVVLTESPRLLLAVFAAYGLFFVIAWLYVLQDADLWG
ncbi:MAG: hypothetical protein ACE5G5_02715 [Candidatus Methylomirabilales bacterium]